MKYHCTTLGFEKAQLHRKKSFTTHKVESASIHLHDVKSKLFQHFVSNGFPVGIKTPFRKYENIG